MDEIALDRSMLVRLRNGNMQPRQAHRDTLISVAGTFDRDQLMAASKPTPREDLATYAAWLTKSGR